MSVSPIYSALGRTAQTLGDAITSPVGQVVIGAVLGVGMGMAEGSLTLKALKILNLPASDPFLDMSLVEKILLTPLVTVIGPIGEETVFRWDWQQNLTNFFGGSHSVLARIQSVFCTSVLFGLFHFVNALTFDCDPLLFLPQVISATIGGFMLGTAKELTGDLYVPVGMHIGNNCIAWIQVLLHYSLSNNKTISL